MNQMEIRSVDEIKYRKVIRTIVGWFVLSSFLVKVYCVIDKNVEKSHPASKISVRQIGSILFLKDWTLFTTYGDVVQSSVYTKSSRTEDRAFRMTRHQQLTEPKAMWLAPRLVWIYANKGFVTHEIEILIIRDAMKMENNGVKGVSFGVSRKLLSFV